MLGAITLIINEIFFFCWIWTRDSSDNVKLHQQAISFFFPNSPRCFFIWHNFHSNEFWREKKIFPNFLTHFGLRKMRWFGKSNFLRPMKNHRFWGPTYFGLDSRDHSYHTQNISFYAFSHPTPPTSFKNWIGVEGGPSRTQCHLLLRPW